MKLAIHVLISVFLLVGCGKAPSEAFSNRSVAVASNPICAGHEANVEFEHDCNHYVCDASGRVSQSTQIACGSLSY